ncbi:GlxA family transcriptional regulator [Nonomuraea sp. NPDC059194]|uniref:GlxA family transcriptional regulator n=1 Tax=Nonomuraea sp. NPDC059194 TaxID=3346764 RepID=UPI003677AEC4
MTGFQSVAAYAPPGVTMLGMGVAGEAFGALDFSVCADRPGEVRTDLGLGLRVEHGLDRLATADLVLALPYSGFRDRPSPSALEAFRVAHERGATVASYCVGTFLLAATGLLDGLEAATHWRFADELAARHPAVRVRPEALYVDQGSILTGAGAASGIDLCLHLLRREHGAVAANTAARELVTPPHRDGGQAQYFAAPVPADGDDERLAEVIAWARTRLSSRLSVEEMAARALMSRRSFARRFKAATGASPHAWLLAQRLNLAEQLLESTDLPIEAIAHQVGYASAAVLRERFLLRRGVPPREYRRAFSTSRRTGSETRRTRP